MGHAMDIADDILHSNWWKFADYTIDGGYIRPVPGSKLISYNPAEAYLRKEKKPNKSAGAKQTRRTKDLIPPYQSLIDMLAQLGIAPHARINTKSLTTHDHEVILQWCKGYGLLGILPQIAHRALLAPRYELNGADPSWQTCSAEQHSLERIGGEWKRVVDRLRHNWPLDHAGRLVSGKFKTNQFREEGVLMGDLSGKIWQWQPFHYGWHRFFPQVPKEESDTYPYPLPTTELFWREYAEPLDLFLEGAQLLLRAITYRRQEERLPHRLGREILNQLVSSVGLTAGESPSERGGLEYRWLSPSLLATFGMMFCSDIKGAWQLFQCAREDCGKIFVSRAYQAAYCSDRCQFTVHKRKQRGKEKARKTQEAVAGKK
jgi:hypothetical protein